jgi:hypothetical protein
MIGHEQLSYIVSECVIKLLIRVVLAVHEKTVSLTKSY